MELHSRVTFHSLLREKKRLVLRSVKYVLYFIALLMLMLISTIAAYVCDELS